MSSDPLFGKHILFMAPKFFGYEVEIARAISARGAIVDLLPDRPFGTPAMAAITRFAPSLVIPAATAYYRKLLSGFGRSYYDIIFIVNGQTLSKDLLSELRSSFPRSRFVLYMWDSTENRQSAVEKFGFFDEISTFDPLSAKRFKLPLRHLFFGKGFVPDTQENFIYHICFIGTAHSDRFGIVSRLDRQITPNLDRFWYLFLQARWVYYAYKMTNPGFRSAKIDNFRFEPIARPEVQDIVSKSRSVLDIEHPQQTGLTMRTLETFGAGKKLVTTNASILDTDLYDARNICVIDRNNPTIPSSFLETPYSPPPQEVYDRYSLDGWIDEILLSKIGVQA